MQGETRAPATEGERAECSVDVREQPPSAGHTKRHGGGYGKPVGHRLVMVVVTVVMV